MRGIAELVPYNFKCCRVFLQLTFQRNEGLPLPLPASHTFHRFLIAVVAVESAQRAKYRIGEIIYNLKVMTISRDVEAEPRVFRLAFIRY